MPTRAEKEEALFALAAEVFILISGVLYQFFSRYPLGIKGKIILALIAALRALVFDRRTLASLIKQIRNGK